MWKVSRQFYFSREPQKWPIHRAVTGCSWVLRHRAERVAGALQDVQHLHHFLHLYGFIQFIALLLFSQIVPNCAEIPFKEILSGWWRTPHYFIILLSIWKWTVGFVFCWLRIYKRKIILVTNPSFEWFWTTLVLEGKTKIIWAEFWNCIFKHSKEPVWGGTHGQCRAVIQNILVCKFWAGCCCIGSEFKHGWHSSNPFIMPWENEGCSKVKHHFLPIKIYEVGVEEMAVVSLDLLLTILCAIFPRLSTPGNSLSVAGIKTLKEMGAPFTE